MQLERKSIEIAITKRDKDGNWLEVQRNRKGHRHFVLETLEIIQNKEKPMSGQYFMPGDEDI